eukprot:Skav230942  [mRNA]  locus=scaffold2774:191375:193167:- [translate_table: standard]
MSLGCTKSIAKVLWKGARGQVLAVLFGLLLWLPFTDAMLATVLALAWYGLAGGAQVAVGSSLALLVFNRSQGGQCMTMDFQRSTQVGTNTKPFKLLFGSSQWLKFLCQRDPGPKIDFEYFVDEAGGFETRSGSSRAVPAAPPASPIPRIIRKMCEKNVSDSCLEQFAKYQARQIWNSYVPKPAASESGTGSALEGIRAAHDEYFPSHPIVERETYKQPEPEELRQTTCSWDRRT